MVLGSARWFAGRSLAGRRLQVGSPSLGQAVDAAANRGRGSEGWQSVHRRVHSTWVIEAREEAQSSRSDVGGVFHNGKGARRSAGSRPSREAENSSVLS